MNRDKGAGAEATCGQGQEGTRLAERGERRGDKQGVTRKGKEEGSGFFSEMGVEGVRLLPHPSHGCFHNHLHMLGPKINPLMSLAALLLPLVTQHPEWSF